MKHLKHCLSMAGLSLAWLLQPAAAQTVYSEDFTGTATTNQWFFLNGACLTAGGSTSTTNPGIVPSCMSIQASYYKGETLVGGNSGTLPDAAPTAANPLGGALRFTNGAPGGYKQNGAIISNDTFYTGQGLQVTFKTITYRGDGGGAGANGADGISFFLMDGKVTPNIGAFGGSLGYSCSNLSNPPYDGLVGGYIGLGIDEYGNFLNGAKLMPGYKGNAVVGTFGDNSALGYGYKPGRIGLRGAGNVAWSWLNANYPMYYPNGLTSTQSQTAVQLTCRTGVLQDTSSGVSIATKIPVLDYAPIPNAYKELSGVQISTNNAKTRSDGKPIFYNLKITQDGLLSLSYSINGGAYQSVISKQSITAANGPLPKNFRFGFAGSTGGSNNIHEIMCFKAASADQSGSSATVNEKQAAKVEAGTQAYFAFYNPNNWTGKLTANDLIDTAGSVSVRKLANWDASCVLTGTSTGDPTKGNGGCDTTGVSGPTAAQSPSGRVMLTWNGSSGIPFKWSNLSSSQQAVLAAGDTTVTANRLNYLRGDRSNEINSSGVGLYRARDSVLGDIVDSSPIWVGPPNSPYTAPWKDRLYPATTMAENGTQTYLQFTTLRQTRLNVVYTGANDGFLHGFRAGSFNAAGNFVDNSSTPNDGLEVLAYMPNAVLQTIHNASDAGLDYSNTQYGHNFFVNAAPGSGELYYSGAWHTWLVGGLGAGGKAIYALDVTNPSSTNFTDSNAASLVIGEWTPGSITCSNVTSCGNNLGNTYGTPQIRRLHNSGWGVIFGNGFGSSSGDAGIYVMTVDQSTGNTTQYYFSTGVGSGNGIAYVTPADLDGDHITDYVYAGDLKGNVWRFDLTDSNPSNWKVDTLLFTTPSGQPITSQLLLVSAIVTGAPQIMVEFGTGQRTQLTNSTPVTFASGTQTLYGVWDWNLSAWNTKAPGAKYASLAATAAATGLTSPYKLAQANLQQQVFSITTSGARRGTSNPVCWRGSLTCTSGNDKFGWYVNLPGSAEQMIFNPVFHQGAFIADSTVPANNIATSCTSNLDAGFTYVISVATGGVMTTTKNGVTSGVFPNFDPDIVGVQTDATGSPYVVTTVEGTTNLIFQTVSGTPGSQLVNIPSNTKAKRLTWIQRR